MNLMKSIWKVFKTPSHQIAEDGMVNRKPFSTKALVGWWARGTDKDKFVTELSDKMVKFMQGVKAIQESRK